ncbi:hypothetical protein MRB53_019833 [Persea americana]|uniref:Uncharacterized protein n=1 Tax=Persea americana TaxID=3435 RepID=A0ACC2L058_PERAE|nr:hypothetical protein MRB53_019833 [Persea americana]
MLLSTVELLSLASYNPFIIFCLCNLIIAVLIISGSKSLSPSDDQNAETCVANVASESIEEGETGRDEDNSDHPNYCAEESDDELRRRVEEFIEKINRRWKAEKMQVGFVQQLAM